MLTTDSPAASVRFADFDHLPIGLTVVSPTLDVLFWNSTLEQWTGTSRRQALGQKLPVLSPAWGKKHYAERLALLFEGGPPAVFSPLLHPNLIAQPGTTSEGLSFHVKVSPVPDGHQGWWAVIAVEDVTVLWRRIGELRALRSQQERLMREIHHRVKNNLNMISSLVTLQKEKLPPQDDRSPWDDLQSRIVALAEIHEILYQSTNLSAANPASYLENLGRLLDKNLSTGNHRLTLALDPTAAFRTDTTVLLGLIQAELMTNALKYGVEDGGELVISLAKTGPKEYEYSLTQPPDTLPADFNPSTSQGLGLVLVTAYADQLGTELRWSQGRSTRFWLRFSE
jgi:two-component sensor histidine kinase